MCACSFKSGNRGVLLNQGYSTVISGSSFANGNTYADFMFYRCISEEKFLDALNTIQIDKDVTLGQRVKTEDDVKRLAQLSDEGGDLKKWNTNLKTLLGSIKFDQSELENASCKRVAFSKD